jgi:NAD(P)-dependent dehydrogenase (short-subunit alcohol dehydrogenase family)
MTGRLEGKTAFVTAAAQGIGRATAEAFAREGARVIAADKNKALLRELDDIRNVASRYLDATDAAAVAALAREVKAVDILFNAVGWVHHGSILHCDPADWDRSFEINVRSMYLVIRSFLPAMLERAQGGSIINIASVVSAEMGVVNRAAYGATKAAVVGLTKSVAADYVKQGIRCNAICPGTVETPSLHDRINAQPDPEKAKRDFIARQPMGRFGRADEVAELAVYLASDAAAFMTGQAVVIDGGMHM